MHIDRRMFLKNMTAAGGAMLVAPFGRGAEIEGESLSWVDMGPAEDFPLDQPRVIAGEKVIIFRSEGGVKALSARCTHNGCTVVWTSAKRFQCPCHSAAFDENGKVLKGPADSPLPALRAKLEKDRILVELE